MDTKIVWIAYVAGAFLALLAKYTNWISMGKYQYGKGYWESTKEWFSLALPADKMSWLTTVGIVWVIGSLYIEKLMLEISGLSWLKNLPIHSSIAFLLGILAEYLAPAAMKQLLKKLSPDNGG